MLTKTPPADDSRAQWITQTDLAAELQVSRTVITKRAQAHQDWEPHYRKRDNPQNRNEMESRVFSPQEADVLRQEITEAKRKRRGPWRYPAPRSVPDIAPAPGANTTPGDTLQEINEKLDRLLRAWSL